MIICIESKENKETMTELITFFIDYMCLNCMGIIRDVVIALTFKHLTPHIQIMAFYGEAKSEQQQSNFFRIKDKYYHIEDLQDMKVVIIGLFSFFFFKCVYQTIEIINLNHQLELEKERNKELDEW